MRYTSNEGINSSLTGDCDPEQHLIWKKEKRKVMSNLKVTNNAVQDLSVIQNYTIEIWSESQADKYYKLKISACFIVAEKRQIGKLYPEIGSRSEGNIYLKANNFLSCIGG